MSDPIRRVRRRHDEDGASAVEYALLVAGIAALCALIFFAFGAVIKTSFIATCSNIATQSSAGTAGSCGG